REISPLRGQRRGDGRPARRAGAGPHCRAYKGLEDERRRLIDRYAAEQMTGEEYVTSNRALASDLERLIREKAKLAASLRSPQHEDFVDLSSNPAPFEELEQYGFADPPE